MIVYSYIPNQRGLNKLQQILVAFQLCPTTDKSMAAAVIFNKPVLLFFSFFKGTKCNYMHVKLTTIHVKNAQHIF